MKNPILFLAAILLSACLSPSGGAPQVTVTSEVTVTLTPMLTPTFHPDFIVLQESIAGSGKRFTLQADGLLYDGETRIPGMTVAPDGTMTLTVNGETITLDPADVDFDDEAGITIDGYEWDADEEAWVEANGTVTVAGGLKIEIGEPDENGYSEVEEITLPFNLTPEEKAEKEYQMDATTFGFSPDATRLVYDNETDTLKIVSTTDPTNVIAEWGRSDTTGQAEMIYDFSKMVDEKGENALLSVGWVEEMSGGKPKDPKAADRSQDLRTNHANPFMLDIANRFNGADGKQNVSGKSVPIAISGVEKIALPGFLVAFDDGKVENIDLSEGVLFIRDSGNVVRKIPVNNFDAPMRGW